MNLRVSPIFKWFVVVWLKDRVPRLQSRKEPVTVMLVNTLRPRQNGRHFADDIFKCILLNENVWIPNKISLKFVPKGPMNNIPSLVQIMAWRRPGDKPLSEPMMVSSLTHICVTRPQWVNDYLTTDVIWRPRSSPLLAQLSVRYVLPHGHGVYRITDRPSAIEETLMDRGKDDHYQTITKQYKTNRFDNYWVILCIGFLDYKEKTGHIAPVAVIRTIILVPHF